MRKIFTPVLPIMVFLTALVLTSCRLDEGPIVISQVGDIPVEFQFEVGMLKALTKSEQRSLYDFEEGFEESYAASQDSLLSKSAFSAESKISNLWVLQFNNGKDESDSYLAISPTYLSSVSSTGKIEPLLLKGHNQTIYLVANTSDSKLYINAVKNVYSISDFRDSKLNIESLMSQGLIPMIGKFDGTIHSDGSLSSTDSGSRSDNQIKLRSLFSRITLKYKVADALQKDGDTGTGKYPDLQVMCIRLVNVPNNTTLFPCVKADTKVRVNYDHRDSLDAVVSNVYSNLSSPDAAITFYMPENIGGTWFDSNLPEAEQGKSKYKTEPPAEGEKKSTASYLEITCNYIPYEGGSNEVTYRTYLGNAPTVNYNILSSYNYTFTITLGGAVESGRVSYSLPIVTTDAVSARQVPHTGIDITGTVRSYGLGGTISELGIIYSKSPNPLRSPVGGGNNANIKVVPAVSSSVPPVVPADGHPFTTKIISGINGIPPFNSNSKYYYRAYARNEKSDYAHGEVSELTTSIIVNMGSPSMIIVEGRNAARERVPEVYFQGNYVKGDGVRDNDGLITGFKYSVHPEFPSASIIPLIANPDPTTTNADTSGFKTITPTSKIPHDAPFYVTSYVSPTAVDGIEYASADTTEFRLYTVLTDTSNVEKTTAYLGGIAFGTGWYRTTERGVRYKTEGTAWEKKPISTVNAEGSYGSTYGELSASTLHQVQAYMTGRLISSPDRDTTVYGHEKTFTTKLDLETWLHSTVGQTTAQGGGRYTIGTVNASFARFGLIVSPYASTSEDQMILQEGEPSTWPTGMQIIPATTEENDYPDKKFTVNILNLSSGNTYKTRAYYQYADKFSYLYGDIKELSMLNSENMVTQHPKTIDSTKAKFLCEVGDQQAETWYQKGFLYSLAAGAPDILTKNGIERPVPGESIIDIVGSAQGNQSVGTFTYESKELLPNTQYKYRAYVQPLANSDVVYANHKTFATDPIIKPIKAEVLELTDQDAIKVKVTVRLQGGSAYSGNDGGIQKWGVVLQSQDVLDGRPEDVITHERLPEYPNDASEQAFTTDVPDGKDYKWDILLPASVPLYIARTYALTSDNTVVYGDSTRIISWARPTISTVSSIFTNISATSAKVAGEFTDFAEEGSKVRKHGIYWKLASASTWQDKPAPELDGSETATPESPYKYSVEIGVDPDAALADNTAYSFRAYGINDRGFGKEYIGKGDIKEFITDPIVGHVDVGGITSTGGKFTFTINRGGSQLLSTNGLLFMLGHNTPADLSSTHILHEVVEPTYGPNDNTESDNKEKTITVTDQLTSGIAYTVYPFVITSSDKYIYGTSSNMITWHQPVVTASDATDITTTSAKFTDNVISGKLSNSTYTEKGIMRSKNVVVPVAWTDIKVALDQSDTYSQVFSDLPPNTLYDYKAYIKLNVPGAQEEAPRLESVNKQFTTLATHGQTDAKADGSTLNTVTLKGSVNSDGGATIMNKGILISKATGPEIDAQGTAATHGIIQPSTAVTGDIYFNMLVGDDANTLSTDQLPKNNQLYIRPYVINAGGVSYGTQVSFKTANTPTVTAEPVLTQGVRTATLEGNLGDIGNVTDQQLVLQDLYFKLASDAAITTDVIHLDVLQTSPGDFTYQATSGVATGSLAHGTEYYYRAYAKNAIGTTTSTEAQTFTTPGFPSGVLLTTLNPNDQRDKSHSLTGTSTNQPGTGGSGGVYSRGFVYARSLADLKWSEADATTTSGTINTGSGAGGFTTVLSDAHLVRGMTYYVLTYGKNNVGIAYSNPAQQFTTPDLPTGIETTSREMMGDRNVKILGTATNHPGTGGSLPYTKGFVYSQSKVPVMGNNTTTSSGTVQVAGTENSFSTTLDERHLLRGTTYYVRTFAKNALGPAAYGTELSFQTPSVPTDVTNKVITAPGDMTITLHGTATNKPGTGDSGGDYSRGFVYSQSASPEWGTTANTTSGSVTATGDGNTFFYKLTDEHLIRGTRYYIRTFAKNALAVVYPTTPILQFITPDKPRSVTHRAATSQGDRTATMNGTATDFPGSGGSSPYTRGFVYSEKSRNAAPAWSENNANNANTVQGSGSGSSFSYNLTSTHLARGTEYRYRTFARNACGITYPSGYIDFTTPNIPTGVTTSGREMLGDVDVRITGTATNNPGTGGSGTYTNGFVYSRSRNPVVGNTLTTTSGTVSLNSAVTSFNTTLNERNLIRGTTYYVRTFAKNAVGSSTIYGSELNFQTPNVPNKVTMGTITGTGDRKLTLNGTATNNPGSGGSLPYTRGFVYSRNTSSPAWSSAGSNTTSGTVTATGTNNSFTYNLTSTNLARGTTYYIRTFAKNALGTTYPSSGALEFLTPNVPSGVSTEPPDMLGDMSVGLTGDATNNAGSGGGGVYTRGFVYSTSTTPTWSTPSSSNTTRGTVQVDGNSFVTTLNTKHLIRGRRYYARAYAKNSLGTTYGNAVNFITPNLPSGLTTTSATATGTTAATLHGTAINNPGTGGGGTYTRGFVYSTSANPEWITPNSSNTTRGTVLVSGVSTPFNTTLSSAHLKGGTTYYVRTFAKNDLGTEYASPRNFKTWSKPTVVTVSATPVGANSKLIGRISDNGATTISKVGFVYSLTNTNPILSNVNSTIIHKIEWSQSPGNGGIFTRDIPLVNGQTVLYARAYAINAAGTSEATAVAQSKMKFANKGGSYGVGEGNAVWYKGATTQAWWAPFNVGAGMGGSGDLYDQRQQWQWTQANPSGAVCPSGWNLPTKKQMEELSYTSKEADWGTVGRVIGRFFVNRVVFLPMSGYNYGDGVTGHGHYWTSTTVDGRGWAHQFGRSHNEFVPYDKDVRKAIRCVKD